VALALATSSPQLASSLVTYEPVLFSWLDGDGPWDPTRYEAFSCGRDVGRQLALGDEAGHGHAAAEVNRIAA